MIKKLLSIAALAGALSLPGYAFAEDAAGEAAKTKDHTTTEATGQTSGGTEFFTSGDMRDFYTDDSMQTMRTKEEMAAAYAKMSPDAQAKLKVACGAATDQKFSDMCQAANAM